mmetsp:Transcript_81069/g.160671  ORF Transcript_81069/g.160671 Transcript_81069/m.160671 type:complete len:95 (+) Transcript_81069:55-339(+)
MIIRSFPHLQHELSDGLLVIKHSASFFLFLPSSSGKQHIFKLFGTLVESPRLQQLQLPSVVSLVFIMLIRIAPIDKSKLPATPEVKQRHNYLQY